MTLPRTPFLPISILAAAVLTAAGPSSMAAPSAAGPPAAIEAYAKSVLGVPQYREVAISPDGTRVAWVESLRDAIGAPSGASAIWIGGTEAPASLRRLVSKNGGHSEHSPAWSPDSRRLAFLSDAAGGRLQLYVADADGGPPRRLTDGGGLLADPHWSPDGKTIAVLLTESSVKAVGPTTPKASPVGAVDESFDEQRLAMVDPASGSVRLLSPPDLYVYEYDWAPDGRRLAAIAAHGSGDNNWYIAQLYTIDSATGATVSLYRPPLQIAVPRWSPDGARIAFIMGLMSDEGVAGGDVFVIPAAGGSPRNLTPGVRASAVSLAWKPQSDRLLVAEVQDGESALTVLGAANGSRTTLLKEPGLITTGIWGPSFSMAADGERIAAIRHSFRSPPEVWAGPIGKWRQVTHSDVDARPRWGEARSLHWESDGMRIQGWLVYPERYDPGRRYPLAVWVHGGPGRTLLPHWPAWDNVTSYVMDLPARGYFVFFPNVRGSFGLGEDFQAANVKGFGLGDFRDLMAGVDAAEKAAPIDDRRVGLAGWSYGGYMAMWAVTQTHRFRAVMAGAGIANWQSYYGENQIDEWLIPYFGASVYADPAVYARSSPINFILNAKTPSLVLVGQFDGECPVPQSQEFWHALRTLGVPTQLVIYPGEGHAIARTDHRLDIIARTADWFGRYLAP